MPKNSTKKVAKTSTKHVICPHCSHKHDPEKIEVCRFWDNIPKINRKTCACSKCRKLMTVEVSFTTRRREDDDD